MTKPKNVPLPEKQVVQLVKHKKTTSNDRTNNNRNHNSGSVYQNLFKLSQNVVLIVSCCLQKISIDFRVRLGAVALQTQEKCLKWRCGKMAKWCDLFLLCQRFQSMSQATKSTLHVQFSGRRTIQDGSSHVLRQVTATAELGLGLVFGLG